MRRTILAASIAALLAPSARAQDSYTWTGSGPDGKWSTSANWTGGVPNGNDILNFSAATGGVLSNDLTNVGGVSGGYGGYQILFSSGAGAYTLGGNAVTLFDFGGNRPKIENNSTLLQTINLAVTLDGTGSGNAAEINPVSGDLLFGAAVNLAGATQLRIFGDLGNTVTFSGGIAGGAGATLAVNQNSQVLLKGASTYGGDTFVNAGTLQIAEGATLASAVLRLGDSSAANSPAATISIVDADGGTTVSNAIVVRPSLSGVTGVRTLSATNSSGTNTFSGGVALDADLTVSNLTGGTLAFTGPAFDLKNQTLTVDGAGTVTISSALTNSVGSGKLEKSNFGALTLSGTNTFTGGVTLNAGQLNVSSDANLGAASAPLTLTSGVLNATGALNMSRPVTLAGDTVVTLSAASTWSGVLSGFGGFTKNGAGTLTLSGAAANTFEGTVSLNQGTLALNKTGGNAIGAGGFAVTTNSTTGFGAASVSLSRSEQIDDNATVSLNANGGMRAGFDLNNFTETVGFVTLTSTTNGTATIALGATGKLVLNGDLTFNNNRNATGDTGREVMITGTGTYGTAGVGGTLDLGGVPRNISVNANFTGAFAATADATIEAVITNGSVVKSGTQALRLGAVNSFSALTVNNGTVRALVNGAIPANIPLTVSAAFPGTTATLDFNGLDYTLTAANQLKIGGAGTSVIATGSGTLTLATPLVYSAAGDPGTAQISGNLNLNNIQDTFDIPDSAGTSTELYINAVISGSSTGLTKTGPGTLALGGANTFTGPLIVNAGTLALRGQFSAPVTPQVKAGATLLFDSGALANPAFNDILGAAGNGISVDGGTIAASMHTATTTFDRTLTNRIVTVGAGGATFDIAGNYTNFNEGILTQLRFAGESLNGSGSITKNGGGRIQFQVANPNFSGAVIVNNGTIEAGGTALGNSAPTNTITINGGNWAISGDSTQPSVTLNGGAMSTNGASRIVSGLVNVTSASYVFLNNFWTDTSSQWNITLPNVVSGSGDLTVAVNRPAYSANGGALILQNPNNSLSGTITVGKNLNLTSSSSTGSGSALGTASIVLASGKLNLRDNGSGSNGVLAYNNNVTVTAASGLTANGLLAGTATIDVNRVNLNSGNIFQLGTLNVGGQLDVTGGNGYGVRFNGLTTMTADTTFNPTTASLTLAGGVSGPGFTLTKTGAGTLRLLGSVNIGGYVLTAGTLEIAQEPAPGRSLDLPFGVGFSAGYTATQANLIDHVTLTSAGVIALGVDSTFDPNFSQFTGGLRFGGSANATLNGVITPAADNIYRLGGAGGTLILATQNALSGARSLDVNTNGTAPGTVVLAASNSFSGSVTVGGGMTLRIGSMASLGTGTGTITLDGGTLQLTNGGNFTGLNTRVFNTGTNGGGIDTNGVASITLDTALTGTGSFTKAGNGTLVLTNTAASFTGKTIIAGGTLAISADANLGAVPGGAVADQLQLNGGTLQVNGTFSSPANRQVFFGAGGGTIEVTGSNTFTLASTTTGTGVFTKEGTGTLMITADPNNNTGGFVVNNGVLALKHSGTTDGNIVINNGGKLQVLTANDLGDAYSVTVNSGGVFDLQASDTIAQLLGSGVVRNDSAATTTLAVNSAVNATFSGTMQNGASALAFTKSGANTFTITSPQTYTGNTQINSGLLAINGAGALGNTTITMGDNNGADERLAVGLPSDVWSGGALNRLSDTSSVVLNSSSTVGFTYNGPAAGSSGNAETIGALQFSAGRNLATLVAGDGNEVQITGQLTRANQGVGLLRGANLGGTGAGSTRFVMTNTSALVGASGADGSTTKSIVPFVIGDDSATGNGSGFLTQGANGLRLLTAAEYDNSIAGVTPLRNVSLAAGETVTADALINSLRVASGSVTINPGARLTVKSGAVLFTGGGSIDGALDAGLSDLIISTSNATASTVALSGPLSGNGLTLSSFGATHTYTLGGDNDLVGNVVVNGATVKLTSAKALNDAYPATVLLRPGSTFQLNGNDVTIRNLQANGGTGVFQNGAATPATLTTYLTAGQTVNTVISDGPTGSGALNLVVSGGQQLSIASNSTYTGATEVRNGTLLLSGNGVGTIANTSSLVVSGATLRLTNTNGNTSGNRIKDTAPITLNGATIDFDNNAGGSTSFSETLGAITVNSGAATLTVDKATSGQASTLTIDSLTRNAGAVVNFTSQSNGSAAYDLGASNQSRLVISNPGAQDDGIIGGWATIDSGLNSREFAKYSSSGTVSVTALTGGEYASTLSSGANATQNVKITASPAALTSATQINSLNVAQASATAVDLGGNVLRVESGGVILSGGFDSQVKNGTLTAGNGDNTPGDLVLHTLPLSTAGVAWVNSSDTITVGNVPNGTPITFTANAPSGLALNTTYYVVNSSATNFKVSLTPGGPAIAINNDGTTATVTQAFTTTMGATIANNGTTPVNLVKAGSGILDLQGSTNTYTGNTYLDGGFVRINADANLGAPTAGQTLMLSNASVLDVTASMTLDANRTISVGAGANVIAIASGTSGAGKALTYNGAITSLGSTEGSLQFRSNVTTTNTDPGKFSANLTALNVNGAFRLDAGTVTVNNATNVIGRSLQVGMDGTGSLTYTGGGSLTVGKGINDTLDLGISTSNFVNTTGTLDLSGLDHFTANVDQVRLGFASANFFGTGALTLAANNDITAGTAFTIGGTTNGGNSSTTSTLVFGSGVNNVTTKTFTIGGNKSKATATVASGGVVNLAGFGANTMDLLVGNYGNTGTAAVTNTFDMTGGTLNASLNTLTVGQKTGGSSGGVLGVMTLTGNSNNISANAVVLGRLDGDDASGSAVTSGTLNFGGGTFTVNSDVSLGLWTNNSGGTQTASGTLNLTGGVFTVGGNITTTNHASATATVNLDGGTLDLTGGVINVDAFNAKSGALQNVAQIQNGDGATAAALIKTTAGTLTIAGANAYTGDTNVNAGTLIVAGALSGTTAVNVASGATLKGAGSINTAATVTIAAGATLAPGGGVGALATGSLKFDGGVFDIELASPGSFDQVNVTGSVSLNAPVALQLSVSSMFAQNTSFTLIANDGTDSVALASGAGFTFGGTAITPGVDFYAFQNDFIQTFRLSYNGGDGNDVVLTAVPEPSSASALLAGAGVLASLRRFRRRK